MASTIKNELQNLRLGRILIENSGNIILSSVGCYLLEEKGVNLFNRIQGDYFTVLGFPLLEVLDFLRKRGLIIT